MGRFNLDKSLAEKIPGKAGQLQFLEAIKSANKLGSYRYTNPGKIFRDYQDLVAPFLNTTVLKRLNRKELEDMKELTAPLREAMEAGKEHRMSLQNSWSFSDRKNERINDIINSLGKFDPDAISKSIISDFNKDLGDCIKGIESDLAQTAYTKMGPHFLSSRLIEFESLEKKFHDKISAHAASLTKDGATTLMVTYCKDILAEYRKQINDRTIKAAPCLQTKNAPHRVVSNNTPDGTTDGNVPMRPGSPSRPVPHGLGGGLPSQQPWSIPAHYPAGNPYAAGNYGTMGAGGNPYMPQSMMYPSFMPHAAAQAPMQVMQNMFMMFMQAMMQMMSSFFGIPSGAMGGQQMGGGMPMMPQMGGGMPMMPQMSGAMPPMMGGGGAYMPQPDSYGGFHQVPSGPMCPDPSAHDPFSEVMRYAINTGNKELLDTVFNHWPNQTAADTSADDSIPAHRGGAPAAENATAAAAPAATTSTELNAHNQALAKQIEDLLQAQQDDNEVAKAQQAYEQAKADLLTAQQALELREPEFNVADLVPTDANANDCATALAPSAMNNLYNHGAGAGVPAGNINNKVHHLSADIQQILEQAHTAAAAAGGTPAAIAQRYRTNVIDLLQKSTGVDILNRTNHDQWLAGATPAINNVDNSQQAIAQAVLRRLRTEYATNNNITEDDMLERLQQTARAAAAALEVGLDPQQAARCYGNGAGGASRLVPNGAGNDAHGVTDAPKEFTNNRLDERATDNYINQRAAGNFNAQADAAKPVDIPEYINSENALDIIQNAEERKKAIAADPVDAQSSNPIPNADKLPEATQEKLKLYENSAGALTTAVGAASDITTANILGTTGATNPTTTAAAAAAGIPDPSNAGTVDAPDTRGAAYLRFRQSINNTRIPPEIAAAALQAGTAAAGGGAAAFANEVNQAINNHTTSAKAQAEMYDVQKYMQACTVKQQSEYDKKYQENPESAEAKAALQLLNARSYATRFVTNDYINTFDFANGDNLTNLRAPIPALDRDRPDAVKHEHTTASALWQEHLAKAKELAGTAVTEINPDTLNNAPPEHRDAIAHHLGQAAAWRKYAVNLTNITQTQADQKLYDQNAPTLHNKSVARAHRAAAKGVPGIAHEDYRNANATKEDDYSLTVTALRVAKDALAAAQKNVNKTPFPTEAWNNMQKLDELLGQWKGKEELSTDLTNKIEKFVNSLLPFASTMPDVKEWCNKKIENVFTDGIPMHMPARGITEDGDRSLWNTLSKRGHKIDNIFDWQYAVNGLIHKPTLNPSIRNNVINNIINYAGNFDERKLDSKVKKHHRDIFNKTLEILMAHFITQPFTPGQAPIAGISLATLQTYFKLPKHIDDALNNRVPPQFYWRF